MRSPSKLKPPYPAVVEFCKAKDMKIPASYMTGWVYHIYLNNQKEIDELETNQILCSEK